MKLRNVTEEESKLKCHYCENKATKAGVDENEFCDHCGDQVLMCVIHANINEIIEGLDAAINTNTPTTHIQAAMAGMPISSTKH